MTEHSRNVEQDRGPGSSVSWLAWCPCGWQAAEAHDDEDGAQGDALAHVEAQA